MSDDNKIKPLHTSMTKLPKVYEQVTEYVDNQTGEIISKAQTFVRQVNSKDEFVKLYLENVEFVTKNLNDGELRLLLYATSMVNYNNIFRFDKNFIGYFIANEIMKKSAIYKNFKTLVEKNVFINIADEELKAKFKIFGDDAYFIHPDIVGKKSFKEMLELKRTIVQTFDFEKFTMKQEVQTETKYEGFDEISSNIDKHEVKQINQIVSEDGKHSETEIVIGEKEDYIDKSNVVIDIESNEVITPQPKEHDDEPNLFSGLEDDTENEPNLNDSKAYDIQIMIERRKLIEAENEKQKLDNENLKLQIELKKLELQNK